MPKKFTDPETGLTIRQRNLLFAVVKEYCEFGQTVSSQDLKEKYGFDVSSATIRNEFINLRDLDFLYQPFTNSSSQPTEKSFKLFINQLIGGLQATNEQQSDLRKQITQLESKHSNLQREISKLLAIETKSVGFAVNMNDQSIAGIKNLLADPKSEQVADILDFLENLDEHKNFLLEHKDDQNYLTSNALSAIFAGDNPVLPLGRGWAMVATKAMINKQETVFGVITKPHVLGRQKTLQIVKAVKSALNSSHRNSK